MTDPNRLLRLLADIETALHALGRQPARREIGSHARTPGKPGSRPPASIEVIDARTEIPAQLRSWARLVWEERDAQATTDAQLDTGPVDDSDRAVIAWLRTRAAWIAAQPWADELHTELRAQRARLQRLPGSPLWAEVTDTTPCTQCDGWVITRLRDIAGRPEWSSICDTCHARYDDAALLRARLDQADRLPWTTAAALVDTLAGQGLTVTVEQVHNWGDREQVARRLLDGHRRYLLADVRPRAEQAQRWARTRAQAVA